MKRLTIAPLAIALLMLACNNDKKTEEAKPATDTTKPATAVINNEEMASPMPDSAAMMKNMESYGTPGDPHKMLAKASGNWRFDMTGWMAPGAPPFTSTGTSVNRMILGGRYQESINKSMMNNQPFEGHSTTGYDNAKKVFISSWVDNMGTGIMNMEGTWDEASKTLNMKGKAIDGSTMKEAEFREVFKMVDDNNQVMEMYGPGPDGKEFKMLEIKYKRKK